MLQPKAGSRLICFLFTLRNISAFTICEMIVKLAVYHSIFDAYSPAIAIFLPFYCEKNTPALPLELPIHTETFVLYTFERSVKRVNRKTLQIGCRFLFSP